VEKETLGPAVVELVRQLESNLKQPPPLRDGDWLIQAHRRLLVSRQVLSRSYAFAYYMFGGDLQTRPAERKVLAVARNLFEDQQERLEYHVEHLSKVLTADVPAALHEVETVLVKQGTVTLVKTVEMLCGEMYKCIQDELLPLLVEPMSIAAYRPDGPDKAKELTA
jgi:ariadne-1